MELTYKTIKVKLLSTVKTTRLSIKDRRAIVRKIKSIKSRLVRKSTPYPH